MILAALFYMLFTADMFSLLIDPYWMRFSRPIFYGSGIVLFIYMIAVLIPKRFYAYFNKKSQVFLKNCIYRKRNSDTPVVIEEFDRCEYPSLLQNEHLAY